MIDIQHYNYVMLSVVNGMMRDVERYGNVYVSR